MRDMGKLVIALTVTCVVSALVLAWINSLTEEPIAEQEKLAKLRAIKAVLPPFDNDPVKDTKRLVVGRDKKGNPQLMTFYLGRKEGEVSGAAFQVVGEGYGGFITVMMGVNPAGEISGIYILKHLETPGLGANIEKPKFTEQFKGKSLANSKLVGGNLAVKKDGGDIEALTGATISPRGVVEAVSYGLKVFNKCKEEILKG